MLWPAREFSVSTFMSLECQQAPWPDACSEMLDSQIRHTGYISNSDEHLTNYAINGM